MPPDNQSTAEEGSNLPINKSLVDKGVPQQSNESVHEINDATQSAETDELNPQASPDLTPLVVNPQPVQTMEVHKHPHHVMHKKKWGEYLLEFFMLFLAVFLGFVAENIREGVVESHREKQFMKSLVKDLQLDTSYLHLSDSTLNLRLLSIDTTLDYFIAHKDVLAVPGKIISTMKRSWWNWVFFNHSGTIDQLKYSGGMRLVSNRKIVDSIESYYQQIARFNFGSEIYNTNQVQASELQEKLWNAWDYVKYYRGAIRTKDSIVVNINPAYLNQYLNHLLTIKTAAWNDKKNYLALRNRGGRLIELIKKEYHLENE